MQERYIQAEQATVSPEEQERALHLQSLVEETQAHLKAWHDTKTRLGTHETDESRAHLEDARGTFGQIVRETYTDTYTLARRIAGNDELAEDITQEAYMRAWRGLPKFERRSKFTTWMYRITANTASNHLRAQRKHAHDRLDDDWSSKYVADSHSASDVEGRAVIAMERRDINKVLDALSPLMRAVVVLRDVYDLDHASIGKELGISETASKVRLHRARKILKSMLYDLR